MLAIEVDRHKGPSLRGIPRFEELVNKCRLRV